jgi:hypothetical protein
MPALHIRLALKSQNSPLNSATQKDEGGILLSSKIIIAHVF